MINPKELIDKVTVEEFIETAEKYYHVVSDPTPLMSKPFAFMHEAPEMLQNMGLLLSGLHLGKTMTVLDFGAGTCWLSRYLNQLQCRTISCDVSETALEIGKDLFKKYPIIGNLVAEPVFLHFTGHQLELPDKSIDRIVCFDALHHIPNLAEVFRELARVLKNGGIAGFSEPGRNHSQTPQSQYEMKNHKALENDINVDEIFSIAQKAGFTDFSCKVLCNMELSLNQYDLLFKEEDKKALKDDIWNNIHDTMFNRNIFFLYKGKFIPDSRSHIGLAHSIEIKKENYSVKRGRKLKLSFKISNTGEAKWLNTGLANIGIVRLASHLYDSDKNLISVDFSRDDLPKSVMPGETISHKIFLELPGRGSYRLVFDMVSDGVTWFENVGSKPVYITVHVT